MWGGCPHPRPFLRGEGTPPTLGPIRERRGATALRLIAENPLAPGTEVTLLRA